MKGEIRSDLCFLNDPSGCLVGRNSSYFHNVEPPVLSYTSHGRKFFLVFPSDHPFSSGFYKINLMAIIALSTWEDCCSQIRKWSQKASTSLHGYSYFHDKVLTFFAHNHGVRLVFLCWGWLWPCYIGPKLSSIVLLPTLATSISTSFP